MATHINTNTVMENGLEHKLLLYANFFLSQSTWIPFSVHIMI